jgi:hypothetical protein
MQSFAIIPLKGIYSTIGCRRGTENLELYIHDTNERGKKYC